ncbi:MAG TPA: hypothetical protein VD706_00950 [Candidatus Saccharimonadales bacterium]|nr:hypothetical protein [Candidatus Saccharimonadales bacterium]
MQLLDKSKRIIKSTTVTGTVAALTLAPVSAFAHGGSGGDNGSRGNNNRGASSQQERQNKQRNNNDFNDWWSRNKNRQKATCSERQTALNNKAAAVKEKYTKRLNGLTIIYTGVQAYVTSGDVTVPANYNEMNVRVSNDKAAAEAAVNAIAAPQLNCDDQNNAAAMSDDNRTFKDRDNRTNDSINAAQKALNIYRKDLNTLFEAVINS